MLPHCAGPGESGGEVALLGVIFHGTRCKVWVSPGVKFSFLCGRSWSSSSSSSVRVSQLQRPFSALHCGAQSFPPSPSNKPTPPATTTTITNLLPPPLLPSCAGESTTSCCGLKGQSPASLQAHNNRHKFNCSPARLTSYALCNSPEEK